MRLKYHRLIVPAAVAAVALIAGAALWRTEMSPAETWRTEKPDGSGQPGPAEEVSAAVSAYFSEVPPVRMPLAGAELTSKLNAAAEPGAGSFRRNAAERLAHSLSPVQRERLLVLINEGARRELLKIHGVGETRAEAIEAARPFDSVEQLATVHGVGKMTYASVIEYGRQLDEREAIVAIVPPSSLRSMGKH